MFKKARNNYTNPLIELIISAKKEGKKLEFERVFSHEFLSVTIRNEAAAFLDYIFPGDQIKNENPKLPNFDLAIDYALNGKHYKFEEDESENPFTFIISRNAANFLSSPSKKLNELGNEDKRKQIFRSLRGFIQSESAKNSMCAGNFTRIFLTWYSRNPEEFEDEDKTKDFYKDSFSIENLIQFCVLNIKELSYAELLERFLTADFDIERQNYIRSFVMYEILQKVRDIIGEEIHNNELDDETNSITIYRNQTYPKVLTDQIKKSQPLSWKYEQIPIPSYLGDSLEPSKPLKTNDKVNLSIIPIEDKEIPWSDEEKALFGYTLINIIWTASTESSTIFEFIQSQRPEGIFSKKKRILEYLLFVGVFGYEFIMISSTAFRILDIVVNGDEKLDINRIKKEDRKDQKDVDIINGYADYVVFNNNNISNLAIFSFPIFYDHIYVGLKAKEDSIAKYSIFDLKSRYILNRKSGRNYTANGKGLTPFVYMMPAVMTEPPISTDLCNSYFKILTRLCDERHKLAEDINEAADQEELEEMIETIDKIDNLYLDFITYKFEYQDIKGRYNIFELAEKIFPIDPQIYTYDDKKLAKLKIGSKEKAKISESAARVHPLINHSFVQITNIIKRNETFLNTEEGPLITPKNTSPLPQFKELTDNLQSKLDDYSETYNLIIKKSIEDKLKIPPKDENAQLIGE